MNNGILPCFQRPTLQQMHDRPICTGRGLFGERLHQKTALDLLIESSTDMTKVLPYLYSSKDKKKRG